MAIIPGALLVNAAIGAVSALVVLHMAASRISQEMRLHDLRIEAQRLRLEYAERLERARRGGEVNVDIVAEGSGGQDAAPGAKEAA